MEEVKKEERLFCPSAKKCGGCQLSNLTYAEQLKLKEKNVTKLLGRFCRVEPILYGEPYHYRNKVQAAFGRTRGGEIISGVYQSGTHRIVKTDSCLLEDPRADAVIVTVRDLIRRFHLTVYDERAASGFLRHVLVKVAVGTGEIMVVLVTGTQIFPRKNDFCRALLQKHPEITTVVQNVNDRLTSLVLGEKQTVLYGGGYITNELLGRRFRVSPKSFYQINYHMTERLYAAALDFADIRKTDRVIDAYAGVGTIGLLASDRAKEVLSIESNPEASADAKKNARLNGIQNMRFLCADATEALREMAKARERADVVILDPPRAGSTPAFIRSVSALKPPRVVYVSCNPETLARDLQLFVKEGYRVNRCRPVDMFPHTLHVETVCLMSRVEGK